uniref:Zinc finger, CCHC-type n=1 Tax=Tanacetum cinerariifolium TaxID=118510 RepID=A0A6L2K792_TANCI|nr:zinc finger, CCHC-type [Tanacetum cinerariifolium]
MSSMAKFDIEKFDGSNDFGLWRAKMWCLLIQHGWEAALDPFPRTMTDADKTAALKTDVYKKAHSALLLCLDNKVLRKVNKEDSAVEVWLKLETLYMTKSLANKVYLQKKMFTFYTHSGKKLSEHIDEFNKLIGDLANIYVDIDDEDHTLMLPTSLPPSYDNFVETLLYGRESLTLEDVLSSLNSRELKKMTDAKDDGDGLYVKERSDHRDCPKRNKKKSTSFVKKNAGQGSGMHSKGYNNADLLMAVSEERFLEWIIDSGGSFHMTHRRDFLFDFKVLDDNKACAIMGIGNVRVKMKDGLYRKVAEWKSKGDQGFFDGFVRNYEGKLCVLLGSGLNRVKLVLVYKKRKVLHRCIINAWVTLVKQACMCWKKERVSFGRGQHITEGVIDNVHADPWGPSQVESKSCFRYFLSIIDDYSRRVWVYFLRHKNEVFSKFKEWKQLVENQTGTPQHNGLAEQMNRTLLNKVRCLLIQSGFPDSFWAEATVMAAHLINRSPSTTLEKKTPMDLWSGHLTNYKMLRIFGCVAYSHRLDDVKPKMIISRDAVFNESLMYKDTLKGDGAVDFGKEVEFEVELQGSKVEPTVNPHTEENPGNEDAEQDKEPQQHNLDNYVLMRDRAKRTTTIPARRLLIHLKKDEWVRAMEEEMSSLKKNHTWELVDNQMVRSWVIFSLTACKDYELEQLDVKTSFLHGNLEETIYMRQLPGFEEGTGNKVCLLNKSLYGLKYSPRQWYKRFDVYMIINGFSRSNYDSCVYFKEFAPDDMLIACKSKSEIEYTKGLLRKEFDMKELVQLGRYMSVYVPLGAHFKLSLKDCLSSDYDVERMSKVLYANDVGSLMYFMVCTRPDITYAVNIVSRYLATPGKNHWEAVKWILKYLKGTADVGLVYDRNQGKHVDINGFVDANYAKDPDKGRLITGYVFMVHGCVVSWKATLQHVVALSTTEAEYMALTKAVKEII